MAQVARAPDITTRQLAQKLSASLGVPVLTDNRPGGDGAVAMPEAARGAPDGHTLLMGSSNTHVLNDLVDPNRPFKAHTAFVPVTRVASAPIVLLAGPAFAANGVQELLDRARARPGDLRYATSGLLTRSFGEMIKLAAHVDMLEVRYKSQSDELPNLLSGQIDLSVAFVSVALAHIKSGKLKPRE